MNHEYILGINGLGISPSACIIQDGQIIAMAEEERFTRLKGSNGMMPAMATKYCLEEAKISLEDVSKIAFGWDCNFYSFRIIKFIFVQYFKRFFELKSSSSNITRVFQEILKYQPLQVRAQIREMFRSQGIVDSIPPIQFVPHHLSHAASAFYASSFKEAAILVIDGSGENISTSIWHGLNAQLISKKQIQIPDSLGWFYQTMTEYLGFSPNHHEGKVMALASYGSFNSIINKKIEKIIQMKENGDYSFQSKYSFAGKKDAGIVFSNALTELLGPARTQGNEISQYYKDIAFHTQDILEKIVLNIVNDISKKSWFNGNICIAGGVALNCKLNGKINQLESVKSIYVPPFSSDIGTSFGAAITIASNSNKQLTTPIEHAYWGPSFDNDTIEKILIQHKISFEKVENLASITAQLLYENKIIGWFQGRMEIGARALGARSILASPLDIKNRDFINIHIKNREIWRPFAASILHEYQNQYIDTNDSAPFMAVAYQIKEEAKDKIPAAIHLDHTTRPQFVKKTSNPIYWELINEFGKLSGTYALLNTSFNLKEEPIVCHPEEALRTFYTSALDALVIGNYLITK